MCTEQHSFIPYSSVERYFLVLGWGFFVSPVMSTRHSVALGGAIVVVVVALLLAPLGRKTFSRVDSPAAVSVVLDDAETLPQIETRDCESARRNETRVLSTPSSLSLQSRCEKEYTTADECHAEFLKSDSVDVHQDVETVQEDSHAPESSDSQWVEPWRLPDRFVPCAATDFTVPWTCPATLSELPYNTSDAAAEAALFVVGQCLELFDRAEWPFFLWEWLPVADKNRREKCEATSVRVMQYWLEMKRQRIAAVMDTDGIAAAAHEVVEILLTEVSVLPHLRAMFTENDFDTLSSREEMDGFQSYAMEHELFFVRLVRGVVTGGSMARLVSYLVADIFHFANFCRLPWRNRVAVCVGESSQLRIVLDPMSNSYPYALDPTSAKHYGIPEEHLRHPVLNVAFGVEDGLTLRMSAFDPPSGTPSEFMDDEKLFFGDTMPENADPPRFGTYFDLVCRTQLSDSCEREIREGDDANPRCSFHWESCSRIERQKIEQTFTINYLYGRVHALFNMFAEPELGNKRASLDETKSCDKDDQDRRGTTGVVMSLNEARQWRVERQHKEHTAVDVWFWKARNHFCFDRREKAWGAKYPVPFREFCARTILMRALLSRFAPGGAIVHALTADEHHELRRREDEEFMERRRKYEEYQRMRREHEKAGGAREG